MTNPKELLRVRNLSVAFHAAAGRMEAVSDLSFDIGSREIVGLAGESGSGKSVTGLSLMGLLPKNAVATGRAELHGTDLLSASPRSMRQIRGDQISMIFQEPMTALDPVMTVGKQLSETIQAHRKVTRREAKRASIELLENVGIPAPEDRYSQYPHQLSGGMRQRAMIAIAVSCRPKLLIADEPTTAVDVTIQAQILELLRDLSSQYSTAILFVSHDIGVLAQLCKRIITMYAGQVIEVGPTDDVLRKPKHPYTSGLLGAVPRLGDYGRDLRGIPGRVPPLGSMPEGCRFAPRCPHSQEACTLPQPSQVVAGVRSPRRVRCCRHGELNLPGSLE